MNDLSFEIIEWSGCVLGLLGAILVTEKRKFGFIIFAIYNLLWLLLGVLRSEYGISFLMLAYLAINLRGYIKWSRDAKEAQVLMSTKKDLNE